VLVVDDSPDNQELISAFLVKSGIKPFLANKGSEAVDMADDTYHAILMDIQMPGMDGFEALKRIRAKGVNVPIVAVTAHAMKGDRERCLNSGFNDYLCKPLSRKDLEACIRQFAVAETLSLR
jgi:CheY-like chemotaxis protein